MSSLELREVSIAPLRGKPLFAPLSLRVGAAEIITIMAPSGAGKSTLLDAIGGHLSRDFAMSGEILLGGRDITNTPAEARQIGILFQDAVLFPHLSVAGNLGFGLRAADGAQARQAQIEAALAQTGLSGFGPRDPVTLSGGQKARVALMRALLARPAALLLDEPFAALDTALRAEMRDFTFRHIKERGLPAILVTHDSEDAQAAGGAVLTLAP